MKILISTLLVFFFIFSPIRALSGDFPVLIQDDKTASRFEKNSNADYFFSKAEDHLNATNYDSAIYYLEISIRLYELLGKNEQMCRSLSKISDCERVKGDYNTALQYINKAWDVYHSNELQKKLLLAEIYHIKGTIYLNKGNFDEVLFNLNKSISLREEINGKKDTLLSNTYSNLGTYYYYAADYENALKNYQKAYDISKGKNTSADPDIAMYLQNLGIIYAIYGDYDLARKYFLGNLQINNSLLEPHDPALGQIYLNMGRLNNLTGREDEALENYEKARFIYESKFGKDYKSLGSIYLNIGNLNITASDYEKALTYCSEALRIQRLYYDETHPEVLKTLMNIGYIYYKKGNYNKATEYYLKSLKDNNNILSVIRTYRNLGNSYNKQNKLKEARKFFELSLKESTSHLDKNDPELASSFLNYGFFLLEDNTNDEILDYFKKALEIYNQKLGSNHREVANALNHIGLFYLKNKDYSIALEYFQKALESISHISREGQKYSNPSLRNLPMDYFAFNSLVKKAETLLRLFNEEGQIKHLLHSLETFELAVDLAEKMTSSLSSDSKFILSADVRDAYHGAIHTSALLWENKADSTYLKSAFKYSEKNKASILLSLMRENEARLDIIPDSLQKIEKNLKLDLAFYQKLLYEENQKRKPSQQKMDLWTEKLFVLNKNIDSLIAYLEIQYPEYYGLKYNKKVINYRQIAQKIKKNEFLIEYSLTDSILYSFIISKTQFDLQHMPVGNDFTKAIDELRSSLLTKNLGNYKKSDYSTLLRSSHFLFSKLFYKLEDKLPSKDLIIIPDDKLGYIPFGVLIKDTTNFTDKMDYRSLPYLIKDNNINYSYSATLLYRNDTYKEQKSNKVLAFAPDYENKDFMGRDSTYREVYNKLLPIPGIFEEADNILNIFHGKAFIKEEATESNFKKHASEYDILHLAMHTIIDDNEPGYSKLIFNQEAGHAEDGFLHTSELFNLELHSKMAVLSACKTGYGKLNKGEGIMSLARGFIFAGIPSIVMTLWSVEDRTSADLMSNYYERLNKGLRKNVALREAKLEHLNNSSPITAHPHFWAGYVIIGDTNPISQTHPYVFFYIIIAAILLAVSLLYFLTKKKHQKQN